MNEVKGIVDDGGLPISNVRRVVLDNFEGKTKVKLDLTLKSFSDDIDTRAIRLAIRQNLNGQETEVMVPLVSGSQVQRTDGAGNTTFDFFITKDFIIDSEIFDLSYSHNVLVDNLEVMQEEGFAIEGREETLAREEIVFRNAEKNKTANVLSDANGNVWLGEIQLEGDQYFKRIEGVDRGAPLRLDRVKNEKLQDYRLLALADIDKKIHEKRTKTTPPAMQEAEHASSTMLGYVTADESGNTRFLAMIDFWRIAKNNSRYDFLFEKYNSNLISNVKIANLDLIRERKDEIESKIIVTTKDESGLVSNFSNLGVISENRLTRGKIRTFQGIDMDAKNLNSGKYQYSIEIELDDRIFEALKGIQDKLLVLLSFLEGAYNVGSMKGNYLPKQRMFSRDFMKRQNEIAYQDLAIYFVYVIKFISGVKIDSSEVMRIFTPRTGTSEGVGLMVSAIRNLYDLVGSVKGETKTNSLKQNTSKVFFEGVIDKGDKTYVSHWIDKSVGRGLKTITLNYIKEKNNSESKTFGENRTNTIDLTIETISTPMETFDVGPQIDFNEAENIENSILSFLETKEFVIFEDSPEVEIIKEEQKDNQNLKRILDEQNIIFFDSKNIDIKSVNNVDYNQYARALAREFKKTDKEISVLNKDNYLVSKLQKNTGLPFQLLSEERISKDDDLSMLLYGNIGRIEYLSGFGKDINKETQVKLPLWRDLSMGVVSRARGIILCRIKRYENNSAGITPVKISKLEILNKYFILDAVR